MSTIALPTKSSESATQGERILARALDCDFDVYIWQDEWCLETDNGVSHSSERISDQLQLLSPEHSEPVVIESEDNAHAFIPFENETNRYVAVTTNADVRDDHERHQWEKLVRLAQENLQLQLENEMRCAQSDVRMGLRTP